ncbi:DNA-directed DNA polymerase [Tanacetum coccineum]
MFWSFDTLLSSIVEYGVSTSIGYGVSTSIEYGVSSSLSNTAYLSQQINTVYPLLLDTAYRSFGTETEIIDFRGKKNLPSFGTNPTDCLSLISEYSEEEEAEAMAETMEQYMSKTRTDYGSGQEPDEILFQAWERFKELLMKYPQHYLTEMQEVILFYNGLDIPTRQILDSRGAIPTKTTSDGLAAIQAQLNNLGREIKKVNEKVYAAQVGCEQYKGPHYTKDCLQKEEGKNLKEAYYTQFGGPFQGGGYRATTPGYYQRNNANPLYQERRQSIEDTLSKFMSESAKRHKENSNLIKEIRATTDASIRNQGASIKTFEIQIGQMSKSISTTIKADSHPICRIGSPKYAVSDGQNRASVSVMPLLTYLNLGLGELAHTRLTVELADRTVKYPKGIAKNVLVGIGKFTFPVDFIILDMPEDIKVPLILGRPFLSTARSKIDVYKRKITLRVGEEKIIFKSVKPASSLIRRVYMLGLRERMELNLEARLMGETLVLNRSLDPLLEDYIELNDLNEPVELRRNQGDDLMPTIEEGKVIEKFRTRDEDLNTGIDNYPSYCDDDKKIHIDCAHNLKFSCMIGFEFTHANFFPLLYVNVMSKKFHNL